VERLGGLPVELLSVARSLAENVQPRDEQARLRRAVGSAYYALFHLLVEEASSRISGDETDNGLVRSRVGRAFAHGEMVRASLAFSRGDRSVQNILDDIDLESAIPDDLRLVTDTFIELQRERHRADYDRSTGFDRALVLLLLDDSHRAFSAWSRVRTHPAARLYLVLLLLWNRMSKE
jgi:hypothetical protein